MYYPLAINIRRVPCLIVGAGSVGLRKAQGLQAAGAEDVLVLDKCGFSEAWSGLHGGAAFRCENRTFVETDLEGRRLVFVCTSQRELNAHIARLCRDLGILCNCTDAPLEGDCIVPALARVSVGGSTLSAALMTEGASPAWSRVLRTELEEWLVPHAPMTLLLGRLRPLVLALQEETGRNTTLFRALVHSPLRYALAEGNKTQCVALLQNILPMSLHKYIAELLYDIV